MATVSEEDGNSRIHRSMVRAQIVQSVLIAAISFIIGTIEASVDFFILGVLIIILRGFLISYFLSLIPVACPLMYLVEYMAERR